MRLAESVVWSGTVPLVLPSETCGVAPAVSSGRRNSPGEDFTWLQPTEGLWRAAVELPGDGIEVGLRV